MFTGVKICANCDKSVYPIEELKLLDKIWHKNCFKCKVCNALLNLKNYKEFEKQPYCIVHYPQQKPTAVCDNPEMNRIKENSKFQSNVKYHEDFEKSKGFYTTVADDPEIKRALENSKIISQAKYHEDFEKNIKNKCMTVCDAPEITRAIENQKLASSAEYKGLKEINAIEKQMRSGKGDVRHVLKQVHHPAQPKIASFNYTNQQPVPTDFSTQILTNHRIANDSYVRSDAAVGIQQFYNKQKYSNCHDDEYMSRQRQMVLDQINNDIKTSVYRAIYDYDANEEDELSFRDGDKFINCEQIDVGWMIGVHEKTGKHGMFPSNYAEPVDYF